LNHGLEIKDFHIGKYVDNERTVSLTKIDPADLTDNSEPFERLPGVPETYKYP